MGFVLIFMFIFTTTVTLTVFKLSWGVLPAILVKILEHVLGSLVRWKTNNGNCSRAGAKKYLTIDHVRKTDYRSPFEATAELACLGVQSILQDDLTESFSIKHEETSLLVYPSEKTIWPFFAFGWAFRYGFLLPLRICLMTATLIFLTVSSLICVILNAPQKYFRYCGITYAKLFNVSTGLIVNFHDKRNRPQFPGVAVSNHLSANDVMTIYSGCDYDGRGYTITGQNQGGFVKYLFKYGGKLTPLLLVDRKCRTNRNALKEKIVAHSQQTDNNCYPVLLFPEGYCTNNKSVLQFRKAVFDGHAPIYPIAMKQDERFGNVYWAENTYLPYLFRLLTSWCTIIDVFHLPPMYKSESESEEDFAQRVQAAIARKLEVNALPYDGKLKSAKEQLSYREKLQACFAEKQW